MAFEILTPEDEQQLKQALADAERLREEIKKAKRAGIDVGKIEQDLEKAIQQIKAIQRVYFPKRGG